MVPIYGSPESKLSARACATPWTRLCTPSFSKIWGHMAFDGIQTNHHPFSNLLIRVASYDQVEHLQFAFT